MGTFTNAMTYHPGFDMHPHGDFIKTTTSIRVHFCVPFSAASNYHCTVNMSFAASS